MEEGTVCYKGVFRLKARQDNPGPIWFLSLRGHETVHSESLELNLLRSPQLRTPTPRVPQLLLLFSHNRLLREHFKRLVPV